MLLPCGAGTEINFLKKKYYLTFFLTFYLNLKRNAGAFRSPPHPFGIKKDNNYEKILKIDFRAVPACRGRDSRLSQPDKVFPGHCHAF